MKLYFAINAAVLYSYSLFKPIMVNWKIYPETFEEFDNWYSSIDLNLWSFF